MQPRSILRFEYRKMRVRQNLRATEHLPDRIASTPSYDRHTDINHRNIRLTSTTVYLLRPPRSHSTSPPWIIAETSSQLRNPLTLKPHIWHRPTSFVLSKFHPITLAVSYHTSSSFDKLLFFPQPKSSNPNSSYDKSTLFGLFSGGELSVRQKEGWWLSLSPCRDGVDKFDDIVIFKGKVYVLDREGKLSVVDIYKKSNKVSIGKSLISSSITPGAGRFGWRKRLAVDGNELYLVVRMEEELFEVYKMVRRGKAVNWSKVDGFDGRKVLFMTRDYCFFRRAEKRFPGRKYKNCIVFTKGAFPMYGNHCWEFNHSEDDGDDVAVFRLSDGTFGWEGENDEFPWINWLPPWIFRASNLVNDFQSRSLSESYSQSESERNEDEGLDTNNRDEKNGEVQSDLKDSNSKDEIDVEMPSIVIIESDADSQDKVIGRINCHLKDSNSKNVKDSNSKNEKDGLMQKGMESYSGTHDEEDGQIQCDLNSQEKDDEEMNSNGNIECVASLQEDVSPSLFGPESEATDTLSVSLSAAEEVTRTLLSMNDGTDATEKETSRTNISQFVLGACSSSTIKSHKSDYTATKFEGFDIRSDLVPTLQKIWLKHGNIIEDSIMRSADIIGKALESLATMVRILEENTAESLSGSQVDYLNSTLSDLRCICFKVFWLAPYVEKAVQVHKSKPLLDSLNNLSQLSSQVKERRAILFDELAKLGEEENKLKEEMAKVSKMIPVSRQVNFDEPVGLGLT